jgi:hypothetical protein
MSSFCLPQDYAPAKPTTLTVDRLAHYQGERRDDLLIMARMADENWDELWCTPLEAWSVLLGKPANPKYIRNLRAIVCDAYLRAHGVDAAAHYCSCSKQLYPNSDHLLPRFCHGMCANSFRMRYTQKAPKGAPLKDSGVTHARLSRDKQAVLAATSGALLAPEVL